MKNIKDYSLKELEAFLVSFGYQPYHARQIFDWIYSKGISDFVKMTNLPASLREALSQNFISGSIKLRKKLRSCDGTEKFIFRLIDGNFIEVVSIPTEKRVTGCISSQVGCKFACKFCASGVAGFKRNLNIGEIMDQVLYLKNQTETKKLTHLVFMGTGEPLDNYDNVLKAIRIINSSEGLNIGARRITISTAGLIPGIEKLSGEGLQIELSISLHAADDKIRSSLMPINKIYPLKSLMQACHRYFVKTNRQITFEYILIQGLNSDLPNARNLVKLLKGLNCKVNLIPANPVKELNIAPPGKKDIFSFKTFLSQFQVNVTLRKSRGEDIEAACGQLRLRYEK